MINLGKKTKKTYSFPIMCMKWKRLFLLLLLIPSSVYASYDSKDYKKNVDKTSAEWKRHDELVQQFHALGTHEKEQNCALLHEAIASCQRAMGHCDYILKKIAEKSKKERKKWKEAKTQVEQNKNTIHTEISNLQAVMDSTVAFAKAIPQYLESHKKVDLAHLKIQNCSRRLNNIGEVVSTFNEADRLYEEALSLARDALNLISPYPDEASKNVLREAIENYQIAANNYKKEVADWLTAAEAHKATLKERLVTLKEERKLFEEKELKRSSYEVQRQTVTILSQLIENSSIEEGEIFKEELAELKNAVLSQKIFI